MKKFIILVSMSMSAFAWSSEKVVELDQAQEIKCHSEFKKLGCTNSADEENVTCIEGKKEKLTASCKAIHQARK
jgi:hypothetical protein